MSAQINNRFVAPTRKLGATKGRDNISIIILAGSMGYRMKSYGPKCLLRLSNGNTILDNTLNCINLVYPNAEVILTVGFEADKVIKKAPDNLHIVENQLFEHTNNVEEIRLALNNSTYDNVLIINGDLVINPAAISEATKEGSCVIVDNQGRMPESDVGVTVVNSKATIFSYGVSTKWCQIAYLSGKELKTFYNFCNNRDKNRMLMHKGLNTILERNGSLKAIEPPDMVIQKVENSKDLEKINENINQ